MQCYAMLVNVCVIMRRGMPPKPGAANLKSPHLALSTQKHVFLRTELYWRRGGNPWQWCPLLFSLCPLCRLLGLFCQSGLQLCPPLVLFIPQAYQHPLFLSLAPPVPCIQMHLLQWCSQIRVAIFPRPYLPFCPFLHSRCKSRFSTILGPDRKDRLHLFVQVGRGNSS